MSAARPFSRWLCLAFLLLLFTASPVLAGTVLVVPFENTAPAGDLDWVGESFAEGLSGRLAGAGHTLVTRDQRLAALERLGLPESVPLSRASLLRLGEQVFADWIVLGRFQVTNGNLRARAQSLDFRRPRLFPWVEETGSFPRLLELQGQLAWKILRQLDPALSLSRQAFRRQAPPLQLSAFESYVRGLLAMNRQQQKRYFLQATRLQPGYTLPAFRLGLLYFEDEDYDLAAPWFRQIPPDDSLALEARFYLSLVHFYAGEFTHASQTLLPLAERFPVEAIWNNLGVFASRQGENKPARAYFSRALQEAPGDADAYFNLGVHHLRRSDWAAAASALKQCLDWNPGDSQARLLYAHALDGLGRPEEAERARQQADGEKGARAVAWAADSFDLDRLHRHFRPRQVYDDPPNPTSARARHVAVHIERGQDLLAGGKVEPAQQELTQAILLDPASSLAHLLLADTYQRQERLDDAVAELRASLWSQETLAARLRLAEIYLAQDRPEDARQQVQAALALDPASLEARALEARLLVYRALTPAEEKSLQESSVE